MRKELARFPFTDDTKPETDKKSKKEDDLIDFSDGNLLQIKLD